MTAQKIPLGQTISMKKLRIVLFSGLVFLESEKMKEFQFSAQVIGQFPRAVLLVHFKPEMFVKLAHLKHGCGSLGLAIQPFIWRTRGLWGTDVEGLNIIHLEILKSDIS